MHIPFARARRLRRSTSKQVLLTVGAVTALALTGISTALAVDVANPFNLSGPIEGRSSEFGVPVFTGTPTTMTTSELHAANARAGVLAKSDAAGFTASSASITSRPDGKFLSTAQYTSTGATIPSERFACRS